jgi:diguanylate cyclase (GGDEF)-like protein
MIVILAVDPNKLLAETYRDFLTNEGYICSFAEDENAIRKQLSATTTLLIVDVDGKGLEYLSIIRQINPNIPIVALSSDVSFDLTQNLLKLKVHTLIPKSTKSDKFLAIVEEILQDRAKTYDPEKLDLKVDLVREHEKKIEELSTFNELARTITSTLELKEVLRIIMIKIKDLIKSQALSLLLLDEDTNELVFSASETTEVSKLEGFRLAWGQGIAGWVAKTLQPVRVADAHADPRFFREIDTIQGFKTRSVLCIPIVSGDRMSGVIEVVNKYGEGVFTEEELHILIELCNGFSDRIQKVYSELKEGVLVPNNKVLKELITQVRALINAAAFSILLVDKKKKELIYSASEILRGGKVEGLRLKLGQGLAGWVALHKEAILVNDVQKDPRFFREVDKSSNFETKALICVPLISKNKLQGVLEVINKADGSLFTEKELQLVSSLAGHAAIAIENATLYRKVEIAAITDDLTKLYNSRYLHKFLSQEIQRSKNEGLSLSLLLLDLDNFKGINDTYGHLVGSQVLSEVGQILKNYVKDKNIAGRLGGDEFIIILPETGTKQATVLAEEIRQAIESLKTLRSSHIDLSNLTASIGIATYPDDAKDAEELIHEADKAMYRIKQSCKNSIGLANNLTKELQIVNSRLQI